jgi:glycosyltransferase involved in cell wall biosynthesis
MKICYIVNARIPSAKAHGVQIMKMCEAFASEGHEVTLVAPNRPVSIKDDPFEYYGVKQNFKIQKLWTIDTVPYGRVGFWAHQILFSFVSSFYIMKKDFDIAYSRDELPLLMLALTPKKLVLESHMGRYNFITARILGMRTKLVVITAGLKGYYLARGVKPGKVLVAHDAVDLEEFTVNIDKQVAREGMGLPSDGKVVMYIGALKKWKGHLTLLEASELLPPAVQVVIIGGSDKEISVLKDLYPRVTFLGIRPYKELPVNQRAGDVLVIPNLETDDPFELYTSPLKVFAHMASNVPIVASDVPPLREILSEKNAVIFRPGDARDLADKIEWTLINLLLVRARANRAYRDVEEYTWQKRAQSIIEHMTI